ncbi:hypothetical protein AB1L88_12490 [Tautonia sp. JC769]|uniref:hypothetical protein n=1 Tax=Tautonia sp. JC769 TaxID=3232135 RepID=UPI00345856EA
MGDMQEVRSLLEQAGLACPTIPESLAARLTKRRHCCYSTRDLPKIPYLVRFYVDETDGPEEYAVLSHDGYGVNTHATQYYLVTVPLRMFLHLRWGGFYMNAEEEALKIRTCFGLADAIVREALSASASTGKFAGGGRLTIVGADTYGSSWSAPGRADQRFEAGSEGVVTALTDALAWLGEPPAGPGP